jgi:hypothetical protein
MDDTFRVVYPGPVLQGFRELCREAQRIGRLADVEEASQIIEDQLRRQPREFGDPCFPLGKMQADVYVRAVSPLIIYYAVHRTRNVVFVRSVEWGAADSS